MLKFFTDYTGVKFTGINHIFDVSENFLEFGGITIKWYGVIIAFGFLLAVLFGGRMAYKYRINLNNMVDVLIFGTIGGIVGARLYYVIFEWDYYKDHLGEIIQIWNGGLAIYGGIIGGLAMAYFVCKKHEMSFAQLLDLVGMSLLIGQGIGRWGNFANQEAFGTNTTAPWGMLSEKTTAYLSEHYSEITSNGIEIDPSLPVHPTFLYESLWCLIGFILIYTMCRKFYKFHGQLFLSYAIWYGIGRTIIEGFRTDSLYLATTGIRVSQALSLGLVISCSLLMAAKFIELKKKPEKKEDEVTENGADN
ncbi:MAG: prolipoprotein diacylglyceryl transferase [Clostridia bacterium]|nr:prolipoprotein diacylglyceryl transferase [Clostridia bacterium]